MLQRRVRFHSVPFHICIEKQLILFETTLVYLSVHRPLKHFIVVLVGITLLLFIAICCHCL